MEGVVRLVCLWSVSTAGILAMLGALIVIRSGVLRKLGILLLCVALGEAMLFVSFVSGGGVRWIFYGLVANQVLLALGVCVTVLNFIGVVNGFHKEK